MNLLNINSENLLNISSERLYQLIRARMQNFSALELVSSFDHEVSELPLWGFAERRKKANLTIRSLNPLYPSYFFLFFHIPASIILSFPLAKAFS